MAGKLTDLTLATGATVSTSGGSALTLGVLDASTAGVVTLNVPADTLKLARKFTFTAKAPTVSTSNPSGFTLARRQMVALFPRTLASGAIVLDKATILLETSIETASTDVLDVRKHLAQALIDTDLDGFWVSGSTAT